ncbi:MULTISPECIES: phosphatase PAP2 family protein [Streptomyces]|uniref:Phosphatase PAP2 family protein n=1 Tax=Streptomyces tirandamycinicus TaxID=2174846 RepID=A0A2S1SMG0_9ACTN|nr:MULTISPECIES: phosphatase PAP2 family protein [Streptomyces]AWI27588.1 phosphatase PAP2 family protein [Streptomyces tirandamycinicus]MCY0984217.1 phosphatase PAP2 family protein [Streptomyces tirandamycinicus]NNJ04492.1 phosphatase PAP2 family protein [Streptomyces sp. PKU-MA01144]
MRPPTPTPTPVPHHPAPEPQLPVPWARTASLTAVVAVLLLVTVSVGWAPLMSVDRSIATGLHESALADPGFTRANRVLSDWVWDPWTMRALVLCAVLVLLRRGESLLALWVAAASLLGSAVQQALKVLVGRQRPVWADPVDSAHYAAFPSGHAMTATVTCGLLLWLLTRTGAGPGLRRTAALLAVVSVLGVGFTRLYLGLHWFTDVLAGWLLGVCLVAAAAGSYERLALNRGP